MQKCSQITIPTDWEDILRKCIREWRGKSLKVVVCKLAWGSAVYNIWRYRNDMEHGNEMYSEEKLLQKICWEVRTRIAGKGKFKENEENVAICNNWGISLNVLT